MVRTPCFGCATTGARSLPCVSATCLWTSRPGSGSVTGIIAGELISREQRVGLKDFISRATRGDAKPDAELVEKLAAQLEPVNRSYTEILAQEIRNLA